MAKKIVISYVVTIWENQNPEAHKSGFQIFSWTFHFPKTLQS